MDDVERKVLRRKRHLFSETVEVDEDLLRSLQRSGLINETFADDLKAEKVNTARAFKLLEHVTTCGYDNAFECLLSAIVLRHSWFAKELECDVRVERGDLHLDDDVEREAGMLVHRKFGTSRRLSEFDKKEIAGTIAMKIQMSKEEWKLEINRLQLELREAMTESKVREGQIQEMDKKLAEFIRKNRQSLVSQAHGLNSTSDTLRESIADDDVITRMEERLAYLLERMRRVISERNLMQNDREKCFQTLGITDDDPSLLLHQLIELKLLELPKDAGNYREEISKKDEVIKRVRRLLQDYEVEFESKEQRILRLEKDLVSKDKEMAVLADRIRQLEREKLKRDLVTRAQTAYSNRTKSALVTRSAKSGKRRGSNHPTTPNKSSTGK